MQLLRIELKDITTHKNSIIEFQPGINILTGQNGTGKSTVLKMIGYALELLILEKVLQKKTKLIYTRISGKGR